MYIIGIKCSICNDEDKVEYKETAKFYLMFDKFFGCLNTWYAGEGKKSRKLDLDPYRSISDIRFKVIIMQSFNLFHTICWAVVRG